MTVSRFALNALRRDWRSGELSLIGLSILIAVTCLTSVNFFTDRVKRATERQATELLAADLVLSSPQKIGHNYTGKAEDLGLIYSLNESFRSVVMQGEQLVLTEVKAVDSVYPIRGELRTNEVLFGEEKITKTIPTSGHAWVDSRLLQLLQAQIGDTIKLGAIDLIIDKVLSYEPDRGGDLFNIAPRLLMNRDDLDASGLILPGSRVQYRLLLGGNPAAISQYQQWINTHDDANIRIQGIKDARPEIRAALERAELFLSLAALVSITLAGLAVAMSAQRYAVRHYDHCAILRCLGLQQTQITQIYFIQLVLLGLVCSLLGCLIAYFTQEILNQFMRGITQSELPPPSLWPVLSGVMAGLITVLAFALPQLMQLRKVPPLRVLRRDLSPLPLNNYVIYSIGVIALMSLAPWQSGNIKLMLYSIAGLFITALVLAVSAKLMIKLLKYLQPRLTMSARYGLANVVRRSNQSMLQIIGVGIGVTVMLLLTLIRTDLLTSWQNRLPPGTPNYFLINIQADQIHAMNMFLSNRLDKDVRLYPIVRARLTHINDKKINVDDFKESRARHLASRAFNLSYAEEMQQDNRLLSGSWWPDDRTGKHYLSVEEGIAETLGINRGDSLTFLIGSQTLEAEIVNLRWVEWDSFNVNFFVVANPEALIAYPKTFISSFYMPDSRRHALIELVQAFPGITVFDVDAILKQIRAIMGQIVKTIEFVFIFTLLTGVAVLFAALQATHDERTQESALMRALGANRKHIVSGLLAEFICLGLVTGLLSAIAASAIAALLAEFVFKIDIIINPLIGLIAPLACCAIIVTTGLIGTQKVLSTPPTTMLRKP